jgi:hypothetical protein
MPGMKSTCLAALCVLGLAAGGTAAGPAAQGDKPADVAGTWAITLDLGQGTVGTPSVTFTQDGEKLTGTYSSQVLGEHAVTGTIKGSEIAFGFTATFEGNAVAVSYAGTVEKDSMKGKVKLGDFGEGTFTAKKK